MKQNTWDESSLDNIGASSPPFLSPSSLKHSVVGAERHAHRTTCGRPFLTSILNRQSRARGLAHHGPRGSAAGWSTRGRVRHPRWGDQRPNKRVPPPHLAHTAGVKRSAGLAFTSGQVMVTPAARVGERATMNRIVLREVEVDSDGAVLKRVRW